MARTWDDNDQLNEELKARDRRRRALVRELPSTARTRNDLVPELALVQRDPRELKPANRRVRRITKAHRREVEQSVKRYGVCRPPLIESSGVIIDGHALVEVAIGLGLATIPCLIVDHLNEDDRRLLAITLNRLQEKGDWDMGVLRTELAELIVLEEDISVTGFSLPEIDQILLADPDDEEPDEGLFEPDAGAQAVSRRGDLWLLGFHRLVCGNSKSAATYEVLLAGASVRLVLTDFPYNCRVRNFVTSSAHREFVEASGELSAEEFEHFTRNWLEHAAAALLPGGVLASFSDWRSIELFLRCAREQDLELLNFAVWAKTNAGMGSFLRSQHELVPILKDRRAAHINNVDLGRHGRHRSNLWTAPGASSMGSDARRGLQSHPTVKPLALLRDFILDVTNRGDVVLDPFLGSGSTLLAAEAVGRIAYGAELDPLYVDVAIRRWQDATGGTARLADTGETFDQAAQRRVRSGGDDSAGRPMLKLPAPFVEDMP